MAVKGKGKQIAGKAPVNSSTKRKSPSAQAECSAGGGKKKRRGGVLRFFDDAAADADLDEEEEDLDDDDVDLEDEEADLDFGNEKSKYEKGAGKANPLPFFLKEEEMSGDELEALIRDRYAGGSDYVVYDEDKEYGDIAAAELSLKDATIWRVKCMFGREQQIAFSLMQKFIDLQEFGTKLGIISVFALEHIKGYVYIEADKASDVAEACKGFCNIYSSRIGLVPSNEIPHLLVVRNKVCEVSKGTWVRMKNGKYKGDLGQVVAVDESRKRATIKMIPRVDLEAIAKKYGGGISLKNSAVPAQRLISSHELGHFGPHIEIRRDRETGEIFEVLDGLMFKDGYLYKKMAIGSLVHWGVQPTEHEILKFTETSKAEDGDLDWLSSVYEGRKRMRSTEASTSNGVTKEGSGYDLHELVFFGRKDFGVIISLGKDGIQILKGDAEGQVVVTVKSQEIKKGCDDKMFTASDCHMKTISINDLVKVSEGPMEGRQGIVRHMYKGTLFLYDENQENNSGIFRAKSNICENIKQSRAFGKSSKKSSSSFSIPPMTSCDQEDNPRTFDRYRQRESDQTFSIGQTLRIKKGPLKGYLCRVVGVYRKKVTVKLDSLVKIITVEEQFLSVPNIRSDGCAAAPIGGLSDKGREPLGQSSWDGGRDSWQSLTSSSFPFANNNDQKSDQGEGDPWGSKLPLTTKDQGEGDPWGSKLPLTNDADQEQAAADPWGSKGAVVSRAESSDPWGSKVSVASEGQAAADPWGSKGAVVSRAESSDPWGKKVSVASKDQEQAASDPWGSKGAVVSRAESSDPWGKVSVASKDQEQAAADPWGSKGAGVSRAESSGPWGSKVSVASKDAVQEQAAADPWASKGAVVSRAELSDPWGSKVPVASKGQEQAAADPWGSKGAVVSRAELSDPWGSKVPVASKDREQAAADPWGSKGAVVARAEPSDPWGSKGPIASKVSDREQAAADPWSSSKGAVVSRDKKDQGDADPWGSSKMVTVTEDHGQRAESADPWGSKVSLASKANQEKSVVDPWGSKVLHASAHKEHGAADPWSGKGAATSKDQGQGDAWGRKAEFDDSSNKTTDNWGKASATEQNSPWNAVTGEIKPHTGNLGNDADGWNKHSVKSTSRTAGWGNVKQPGVGDGESWGGKNNSSNTESVTTWGNSSSQAHPEADSWGTKGKSIVNNEVAWDKATEKLSVEDGGKTSSWDKVKTPISSQADQWGKGTSNATGSGGWNKSGFSNQSQKGEWNEEAIGNNQRNDWNKSGDFGGGRGFGRGRGRGRNTWGDNTSGDQEGKWNKPINREGDGGSTWGSGWDHNAAAGGSQDQENSWSKQSDSPGGRGFGRGRGRGRYGGSGNRDDNQTKPYDSGGDWGRGGGRGRGRNGDAGNFSNNFDDAGSFGRGRGRFDSSDWKNNQENFGDGNLSKKSAFNWGNDEQGEWAGGKSAVQGQSSDWNTPKAQGDNQPSSWNQTSTPSKHSSGWATNEEKSWATTPKASPSGSQFSAWNKTAENKDAGKEACGAGGGWGSIKQFDDKKASDGNGAPGAGGNWDKAKPFNAHQLSDWSSREKKDWSSGKQLGEAPAGNVGDDAYAGGDSLSKPGLLGARPAETNNWNEARSSGWKQNSPASEGKAGTNVSNWNKPKTFSGGNQSSGWGNDEGESWTKPNSFGGQSSWSDHTGGFNGGGGGEQSGGWGRGRNDQSYGGRGNSFSGRGRGRGRNFGGGRWNGGRGGNQEGNGSGEQPENFSRHNTFASGQSSSWNQGGFASGGGSWNKGNESAGEHTGKNAGEAADKGSWDYSWKSESGKQPGGWAKQDSKGFEPPAPDGSNKSGGGNWDQPKQSGNSSGSGWTTGKTNAWNEKKPSDGKGQASGGWNTSAIPAKEDGGIGSSSKEADIGGNVSAWEKKEADIGGNGSAWEKKAAGSWGNPKDGNSGGKGGW